jgi:topoisomerase-4 subunit A
LLLAQGVEGIAVGLSCKMLPHNFIEILEGCISILKDEEVQLFPDFITGGMADFSKYNDGARGGKVRIRAKINQVDKQTLQITEIPFGTTTGSLIESIIQANEKGKIKIKKIEDNTSENVEINIYLAPGISPDKTIDALYAVTACEISVSPNAVVIENDKPRFVGVTEVLQMSVDNTVNLLRAELEIEKRELEESWHFSSLEKVFIEERIYRDIEDCETWEAVIEAIDKGLEPHKKKFRRTITQEDIARLTEIKIKRISKFDAFKADEYIKSLEEQIEHVNHHLNHLIEYAIAYFERLLKKYGPGRERRTEIRAFDTIEISKVVINNEKLYVNREEGFAGFGLKKDEYVCECSDIDDIIAIRADGILLVTKISEKTFVGKDILHIGVYRKSDDRTIYNVVYQDGKTGPYYVKRFAAGGVIRDKEYELHKGTKGSRIIYLSANLNGESETLQILLKPKPKLKKTAFDFDFASIGIKGRGAGGNILTKNPIRKILLKEKGLSTLGARKIWFDESVKRLNADERGRLLGEFAADDRILSITESGFYRLYNTDLSHHFDDDLLILEKWIPEKVITAIYKDGETNTVMVKRFTAELNDKKNLFLPEAIGTVLLHVFVDTFPMVEVKYESTGKIERAAQPIELWEYIGVKGFKAKGKRLGNYPIENINVLPPMPEPEKTEEEIISENENQADDNQDENAENKALSVAEKLQNLQPVKVVIDLESKDGQMRLDFD